MANKMQIEFSGFEELAENLDKLGGDLKKTTEKALRESHKHITPKVQAAFEKHDVKYTHATMGSLKTNEEVEWSGTTASIGVGFKISEGGLPSIFLMYGTPTIKPDKKLFNAIMSKKAKKEVAKIQEDVFREAISKLL